MSRESEFLALPARDGVTPAIISQFEQLMWCYYQDYGRKFPWRQTDNPYHILVSEIMLQQTQTSRVLHQYKPFIEAFPDFATLAASPLIDVLKAWQGLGYNRRAVALHRIAHRVVDDFNGELPSSAQLLQRLPGIGPYTASALQAIAFNRPVVFIETNIRAVFIFFFFHQREVVTDKDISHLVDATLDRTNPREWYYALFDYGAMLKKRMKLSERSAHYTKQSVFKGSNREMRGRILRTLLVSSPMAEGKLIEEVQGSPAQIKRNIELLQKEGFLAVTRNMVSIT
ncbi:MAG TPA: A/G-specific adenine glycosylase [Dehalococcoidia bacterium]|nr:A/G-specific adenine glycosylase [Dehalococcoidia bacterium]